MKKALLLIILVIVILIPCSFGQIDVKSYIQTFPNLNDSILKSTKLIQSQCSMKKEEALMFVYNNDTSKLICRGEYYDMIDEKVTGEWKEEKLPKKCFGITTDTYYIIAFTSYECQDPNEIQWDYLNFVLYDKSFNLKDEFIAYKGNEYDYEISSIINIKTQKIFEFRINTNNKQEYNIYSINKQTLRFDNIRSIQTDLNTDNLLKALEKLGLEDLFYY